jgi:hypothetical protein
VGAFAASLRGMDGRETDDAPAHDLTADCSRCSGLCCVLLPFHASWGFGADKDGGVPCHNLLADNDGCGIHARLRSEGWPGCVAYDCFGAGQHVTEVTYGGASWRDLDDLGEMAAVLSTVRQLNEMRWLLREAHALVPGSGAGAMDLEIVSLAGGTPVELLSVDVDDLHERVGDLLRSVSAEVRGPGRPDLARQDLAGQDLRAADLRAADLRGCSLIAADLRGVDLTVTDLLGADLRDADLRGALLDGALFLTQPQASAAIGDPATTLDERLARPTHWAW